jgi:DNA-binding LytR/AlgR family response regulator
MIRAVLADDEDLPRLHLKKMLAEVWPELVVVAECDNGTAALAAIQDTTPNNAPDIAFLDIRMPEMNGIEVARRVGSACHVVFTTAYDAHALDAFEAGACDYLLKPINKDRLVLATTRLQARLNKREAPADLSSMFERFTERTRMADTQKLRWISASVRNTIKLVGIDEVLFFQSDERYTRVVTATEELFIRTPLRELIERLEPDVFWQVHRGVIVRASAVSVVKRDDDGRLTLAIRGCTETVPVSRAYESRFRPM